MKLSQLPQHTIKVNIFAEFQEKYSIRCTVSTAKLPTRPRTFQKPLIWSFFRSLDGLEFLRSETLLAGISWSERYQCRGLAGPRGPPLQKSCMAVGSLQLLKIIPTEIFLAGKFFKIFLFTSNKNNKNRKSLEPKISIV